jgi:hypothetical protein
MCPPIDPDHDTDGQLIIGIEFDCLKELGPGTGQQAAALSWSHPPDHMPHYHRFEV